MEPKRLIVEDLNIQQEIDNAGESELADKFEHENEKKMSNIKIEEIYFDDNLRDVFDKGEFELEIQKIERGIEGYLGENKNLATYNIRVYSNREEYEEYFQTYFPEKRDNFMENDMTCYYDEKNSTYVIAKFMKRMTLDQNDPEIQKYLENKKINFSELKFQERQNYKNNIYPTIAHELTHAHPFFGGIGNEGSENKWEQEMVCVFIDQEMWEKYIPSYRKMIMSKAKEQIQNKNLYEEIIKDFKEGNFDVEDWERLFYPFLKSRYKKSQLLTFWSALFKDKADFEVSFENIFGEKLKYVVNAFQKEVENTVLN
ncbi:MAG: hypothetical protein U9Q12_04230 [Patescibacteria group bacterium]|nr:hypothetical protein [Patescibacteria group bacterium]